jgi:hypothetical protein
MASLAAGAALLGGAVVTGAGFVAGGQIVQAAEQGIIKGYNYIKNEFADKRKNPDVSPIQENTDINTKITNGERELLKELLKK